MSNNDWPPLRPRREWPHVVGTIFGMILIVSAAAIIVFGTIWLVATVLGSL